MPDVLFYIYSHIYELVTNILDKAIQGFFFKKYFISTGSDENL